MFLINLILFKNFNKAFDEDLITEIIMKLIFNWLILCIVVTFYVIKIYYYPKIIDMHVWF
jgi:hypothetical protein